MFNHLTILQSTTNLQSLGKLKSRVAFTHLQQLNENSEDEKLFKTDQDVDTDEEDEEDDFFEMEMEPTLMQGIFQNEVQTTAKRVTSANPDSLKSRHLRNNTFMKRMSVDSTATAEKQDSGGPRRDTESALSLAPNSKNTSAKKNNGRLQSARLNEVRVKRARKPPMRPKQTAKVAGAGTASMGT